MSYREYNSQLREVRKMNYPEFRTAVARAGVTNRELARGLGLSEQAFYNKLKGKAEFKNSEIKQITSILALTMESVNTIFFDGIVN